MKLQGFPPRLTSSATIRQSQPSSSAISDTVRPRPTCNVAQLAAREVNRAPSGAIQSACSVNDFTPHSGSGHCHRRFDHSNRTGPPKPGRSTNRTLFSPIFCTSPPHPPHRGRFSSRTPTTNSPRPLPPPPAHQHPPTPPELYSSTHNRSPQGSS